MVKNEQNYSLENLKQNLSYSEYVSYISSKPGKLVLNKNKKIKEFFNITLK